MRSLVRCGIAHDAGVLFNTAETEQGASPTRSATVRRVTAFLSNKVSPSLLYVQGSAMHGFLQRRTQFLSGRRGQGYSWRSHSRGQHQAVELKSTSATLQKTQKHPEASQPVSPTQKIYCEDQRAAVRDGQSGTSRRTDSRNTSRSILYMDFPSVTDSDSDLAPRARCSDGCDEGKSVVRCR
jgi:hypothetical protein